MLRMVRMTEKCLVCCCAAARVARRAARATIGDIVVDCARVCAGLNHSGVCMIRRVECGDLMSICGGLRWRRYDLDRGVLSGRNRYVSKTIRVDRDLGRLDLRLKRLDWALLS